MTDSPGLFAYANGVSMDHPTFTENHYNFLDHNSEEVKAARKAQDINEAMNLLKKHVAFGALFNSAERYDAPKCHPDTRVALLNSIEQWSEDTTSSTPLIWLRGAAGAGKSAIAQSIAELLNEKKALAASFFFWRTAIQRNESKYLIPTLAYQLSRSVKETRKHIAAALQDDIGIFEKDLWTQMTELIVSPLTSVFSAKRAETPLVIVIDGLDECSVDYKHQNHEDQQREILEVISRTLQLENLPIRFLIASRPERQIRECFGSPPLSFLTNLVALGHSPESDADIQLYIECKFDEIRRRHPSLGPSWPSPDVVPELVRKSSGHFVYAAVVMRHLESPRTDPSAGLAMIMGLKALPDNIDRPFAVLDALYIHILEGIVPRSLPVVTGIFELMLFHQFSRWLFTDVHAGPSPAFIARYFFLTIQQVYMHLVDLHSILEIPAEVAGSLEGAPVTFIHASFSDFLTDPARSGSFFLDKLQGLLHLQLVRLKHVFVQTLSKDGGKSACYNEKGFATELRMGLVPSPYPLPPNQDLANGILVLVSKDKQLFLRYIQDNKLDHLGFQRNIEILRHLIPDQNCRNVIKKYLKSCGMPNHVLRDLWWLEKGHDPNSDPTATPMQRSTSLLGRLFNF